VIWRKLHKERSFLGPSRPTWGDLQRLRDLRHLASATGRRISILEAIRREMDRLGTLLALL